MEEDSHPGFESTDTGVCGQRSTSYTTADCRIVDLVKEIFFKKF